MKVAVIGGGAAGFFAAISCKLHHPGASVMLLEKTGKLLSKVKVSGGGRCNVTHACFNISQLSKYYPRGGKQLKKAFGRFYTQDTVDWFESRGVRLKTEEDNRIFPVTDDSQTIIDCLVGEAEKLGVRIHKNKPVQAINRRGDGFNLLMPDKVLSFDRIIIATGGSPKLSGFDWLKALGHEIIPPVPSLFTFNMPGEKIRQLMGVAVNNVSIRVQGTKMIQKGALLITHWGMSGPAVLKLSAWGARILHDVDYQFRIQVNWLGEMTEDGLRNKFKEEFPTFKKRKLRNKNPFGLPARLWSHLLEKIGVNVDVVWGDMGKKNTNRLFNLLLNDVYEVSGKTTFKEEFVTCGGVSLQEVSFNTMESQQCPGLFFAGEVLDIDGVTGGFNFQAAWTTGFIAGRLGGGST